MIKLVDLLNENKDYSNIFTKDEYDLFVNYLKGKLNKVDKSKLIELIKKLKSIQSQYPELQTKPFDKAYRVDILPINKLPVPLESLDIEYGGEKYGNILGGKSSFQMAKLNSIPFESKSILNGWTLDRDFAFEMLYDTARDNDFEQTLPVLYEIDYNKDEFIFDVDFLEKIRGQETGYGYEAEVIRLGPNKPLPGYVVYIDNIIPDINYD
jgi:hypothetical protein